MGINTAYLLHEITDQISQENTLSEQDRLNIQRCIQSMKSTKVNLLITGATGSGKSSTINALFSTEQAKVGMGVDPETMDIQQFQLNDNFTIYDSPGLGDGAEADKRHTRNIINKLHQRDAQGQLVIDLMLVILDGSSRDLGTAFGVFRRKSRINTETYSRSNKRRRHTHLLFRGLQRGWRRTTTL